MDVKVLLGWGVCIHYYVRYLSAGIINQGLRKEICFLGLTILKEIIIEIMYLWSYNVIVPKTDWY